MAMRVVVFGWTTWRTVICMAMRRLGRVVAVKVSISLRFSRLMPAISSACHVLWRRVLASPTSSMRAVW